MTSVRRRGPIRRLAAARALSSTGSSAAVVALIYALYQQTHSPAWVSAAILSTVSVGGVACLFSGWLSDRYDRRRVMLGSDFLAGMTFALFALSPATAGWLVGLAVVASILESPFGPAASGAVPTLTTADDVHWANAAVGSGFNFGRTLGPILGGLLIAGFGPSLVFCLNAVTFVGSAVLVASLPSASASRLPAAPPPRGLFSGLAVIKADRRLRLLLVSSALAYCACSFAMVTEAPLVTQLGVGSVGLGMMAAGWGIGCLVGARVAAHANGDRQARYLLISRIVMGAAFALIAAAQGLAVVVGLMALGGAGSGYLLVSSQTFVQRWSADGNRSRVFAAMEAVGTSVFAASMAGAGFVVSALGPHGAYAVAGTICLLAAVPLVLLLRIQERRPASVDAVRAVLCEVAVFLRGVRDDARLAVEDRPVLVLGQNLRGANHRLRP